MKKRQKISSSKGKLANLNKLCDIKKAHKSNSKTFSLFESDLDSLFSDTDDEMIDNKMLKKKSEENVLSNNLKFKELTKKYEKVKLERNSYKGKCHDLEKKLVEYQEYQQLKILRKTVVGLISKTRHSRSTNPVLHVNHHPQ